MQGTADLWSLAVYMQAVVEKDLRVVVTAEGLQETHGRLGHTLVCVGHVVGNALTHGFLCTNAIKECVCVIVRAREGQDTLAQACLVCHVFTHKSTVCIYNRCMHVCVCACVRMCVCACVCTQDRESSYMHT